MVSYAPIIQSLNNSIFYKTNSHIDVLRLDLLHPEISGNKWFKLKYNLLEANEKGVHTILTFGGAFSNHIAATAAACKLASFKSIGVIRGEQNAYLNSTLHKAKRDGMHLHFITRGDYKLKHTPFFQEKLMQQFGSFYLIPEGGDNNLGIKGCMEIVSPQVQYDYILCACGTGTTYAGIVASVAPSTKVIGISVLKGENNLPKDVVKKLNALFPEKKTFSIASSFPERHIIDTNIISNAFAFNGYAKYHPTLIEFKKEFETQTRIPLDYIYTIKLFYAMAELHKQNYFPKNSKILIIHSGGLQGNEGFEIMNKL
jgi:1-aminocyclopropane-1-carboxylate deaminase